MNFVADLPQNYELGEDAKTIQAILRHADVKTTRRPYIKKNVVSEESRKAMNRLAQVFKKVQKPACRHSFWLRTWARRECGNQCKLFLCTVW
jgi:hypothetical protein